MWTTFKVKCDGNFVDVFGDLCRTKKDDLSCLLPPPPPLPPLSTVQ